MSFSSINNSRIYFPTKVEHLHIARISSRKSLTASFVSNKLSLFDTKIMNKQRDV